jgi:hypothetical protein
VHLLQRRQHLHACSSSSSSSITTQAQEFTSGRTRDAICATLHSCSTEKGDVIEKWKKNNTKHWEPQARTVDFT